MSKLLALIATLVFTVAVLFVCAATVFGAAPVNVTISQEVINVTIADENGPVTTITVPDTEVVSIVTAGEQGIPGPVSTVPGPGVPPGGTNGQILTKNGLGDFSTVWQDLPASVSSWNDLTDKPALFSGVYSDLTGLPALFSGNYADLSGTPLTFPPADHNQAASTITGLAPVATSGSYIDLSSKPTLFSGAYGDLSGLPLLFSGSYTDLSNKPVIPAAQVNSDWNASGTVAEIINKPTFTRGYDGREVEVRNSGTHIQWRYIADPPATWTDLVPLSAITGTPGTNGKTYTCFITGGLSTITYDKNGSNPAPVMVSYGAEIRENGSVVTPSCSWSVPASGSLLSGSSATCNFTPVVAGTWSAGSADNRINLAVSYAGITCNAVAPVAITKVGADGLPADPENKQMLYTRIGVATTGDVLNTQCGAGDAATFAGRTFRATGGDIHRTDLCGGQTWIHARPTDAAGTMKLGVKDSNGNPLSYFKKEGDLVVKGALVIQ